MQTFLPYQSFTQSARCLDYRRLGKQRVEAMQILDALEGRKKGWANHPATLMWKGCETALKLYFNCISEEWVRRGYKHNMGFFDLSGEECLFPSWLGNNDFHLAHQSNLTRKKPEHYGPMFPGVPDDLEYVWPVNIN
jgi:hypothetical protein